MLYKHRNKAGRESRRIPYIYAATPSLCSVCALYAAVCEINKVDVMRSSGEGCLRGSEDGGMMVRPQGGGGVDHPKQVQQNKTQTDKRFFHTPGVLVTLKKVCYSLFTRLKTAIYGFIEGQEGLLLHLESQALWLSREYVYYSC